MSPGSSIARYNGLLIALHWITLVLVVAGYALMEFKDIFPKGSGGRERMETLHYSVGITIFVLTLVRLPLRAWTGTPAIEPPLPRWQQTAARIIHALLYAMLLALPITGWLSVNADGQSVLAWGYALPDLLGPNESLSETLKDLHESIASVGYALVGIHALAALYHHYIVHDNTLRRMLPGRRA